MATCCRRCCSGDERGALETAGRLQDIFGRDNLFVELQDHGLPAQRETNPQLIEIATRIGAPLLATNDSHYTHREDHESPRRAAVRADRRAAQRSRSGSSSRARSTTSSRRRRCATCSARSPRRATTRCGSPSGPTSTIEFGKPQLPDFPLPEGFTDDAAYLQHLTWQGARERWGDDAARRGASSALAYELQGHRRHGVRAYFLIVWDLISTPASSACASGRVEARRPAARWRTACGSPTSTRSSYDLLFERFLNPSRISMPDIDMDFDSRYRDEMIRYAAERYGRDHVAQIITFGTIKARNAVRDAARVLGLPVRRRRQDRQGDAAARDGSRHAAQVLLRAQPQVHRRLQGGQRPAGDVRRRPRREEGRRRRQGARGAEALRRHPRRGGGDHQGAAHRRTCRSSASRRPGRTPRRRRSSPSSRCTASRTSAC